MGNYFSILQWSNGDTAVEAPELSKAEVDFEVAKQKIDSEVTEIVQEIEAEKKSIVGQEFSVSESYEEVVIESSNVDIDRDKDSEVHLAPSVKKSAAGVSSEATTSAGGGDSVKKEKKWYHRFTGNVQRSEEVTLSILNDRRIRAMEKRAAEMKAELDKQLEQVQTRNKIRLLALQQKIHPDFRGKEWHFDEKKNFNFAVVGCSGVGKSTFINSLLGLLPYQPGAARVSAGVEGTLVMQPYSMPDFPFIRIWDIPGGSGIDRPADSYFDTHCLDLFDAVLCCHEGRHHALQAMVVLGCLATNTPVYVIVTKMDLLVDSQLENHGLEPSESNVKEAVQVISDSISKECTLQNERFLQQEAGVSLLRNTMRLANTPGTTQLLLDEEECASRVRDVPFYYVSKRFASQFGSFDAEKVVSAMKDAAAARMPTSSNSPLRKVEGSPGGSASTGLRDSPLRQEDTRGEAAATLKASASLSPQGSPMPFCRDSLKLATISSLVKEMGVEEEPDLKSGMSPPPPPYLQSIKARGAASSSSLLPPGSPTGRGLFRSCQGSPSSNANVAKALRDMKHT